MSVVVESPEGLRVYVKGAPEVVASHLATPHPALESLSGEWAARGLRVLFVAGRALAAGEDAERDLEPIGLIGLVDPLRASVAASVATAAAAGVRTVMVTGDHPVTAVAIASECGIGPRVMTGVELEALGAAALRGRAPEVDVFARAWPEHKQRIVEARSGAERGEIVAMTGDGINDIPGLWPAPTSAWRWAARRQRRGRPKTPPTWC